MSLRISCEFCEAKLTIRDDKVGQEFKCPSCRKVISARATAANNQSDGLVPAESQAAESFDEGSHDFSFVEEFDLEGLLPEANPSTDDLSRMPPARKTTSRGKQLKAKAPAKDAPSTRPKSKSICTVCQKQMDPGVRYCIGCGHNNFDADAVAVDAQLKMQTRMEQLSASLGVARILKIFSRMFR